jgi:putative membrane protein
MSIWRSSETFAVLTIGKRLAISLAIVIFYCTIAGSIAWWWNIRLFAGGTAASVIGTVILGLLLSFRNRVAYERWWEARGLWGQLTNHSRNLAVKLAALLPGDALARSRAAELITGFSEALKRHLRGDAPHLQDLPGFEKEDADPDHVPLYLSGRLYNELGELIRTEQLDGLRFLSIDEHVRGFMNVCGGCEKIRNTPLVPAYRALVRTGLALKVLAEPWLTMADYGLYVLPLFLLVCFFLFGLEVIITVVEEPFASNRDALDLDGYCKTIRESVYEVLPAGPSSGLE